MNFFMNTEYFVSWEQWGTLTIRLKPEGMLSIMILLTGGRIFCRPTVIMRRVYSSRSIGQIVNWRHRIFADEVCKAIFLIPFGFTPNFCLSLPNNFLL